MRVFEKDAMNTIEKDFAQWFSVERFFDNGHHGELRRELNIVGAEPLHT